MKLVNTALEWSYADGEKNVNPKHLEAAAEQLTVRSDVIQVIDAPGQSDENGRKPPTVVQESNAPSPK